MMKPGEIILIVEFAGLVVVAVVIGTLAILTKAHPEQPPAKNAHGVVKWRRKVPQLYAEPREWPRDLLEQLLIEERLWLQEVGRVVIYGRADSCVQEDGAWYCIRAITFDKYREPAPRKVAA